MNPGLSRPTLSRGPPSLQNPQGPFNTHTCVRRELWFPNLLSRVPTTPTEVGGDTETLLISLNSPEGLNTHIVPNMSPESKDCPRRRHRSARGRDPSLRCDPERSPSPRRHPHQCGADPEGLALPRSYPPIGTHPPRGCYSSEVLPVPRNPPTPKVPPAPSVTCRSASARRRHGSLKTVTSTISGSRRAQCKVSTSRGDLSYATAPGGRPLPVLFPGPSWRVGALGRGTGEGSGPDSAIGAFQVNFRSPRPNRLCLCPSLRSGTRWRQWWSWTRGSLRPARSLPRGVPQF